MKIKQHQPADGGLYNRRNVVATLMMTLGVKKKKNTTTPFFMYVCIVLGDMNHTFLRMNGCEGF